MDSTIIHLDVRLQQTRAEVRINDFALPHYDASVQDYKSIPAPKYLIDGVNTLEVIVNPGPTPSRVREPYGSNVASTGDGVDAKLVRYPEGVYSGDPSGQVLADARWSGSDEKRPWPQIVVAHGNVSAHAGRWRWQDGDLLTPADLHKRELLALLVEFHAAMTRGDAETAFQMSRMRFEDAYRAYPGADASDMGRDFRNAIEKRVQDETWHVDPIRPDDFDFRLCASGRMIECIYVDWKPFLTAHAVGRYREYSLPVFVSRFGGVFRIVR